MIRAFLSTFCDDHLLSIHFRHLECPQYWCEDTPMVTLRHYFVALDVTNNQCHFLLPSITTNDILYRLHTVLKSANLPDGLMISLLLSV
jgi:hypothetical protein